MIRRTHLLTGAIVLAVELTATLAPAASADPQPLPQAEAAIAAASQAPPAVTQNPDEQVLTARPAGLAVPVAPTLAVQPNPDEQTPPTATATIVRVSNPSSGFNWGDAGIGAAGALGLGMLTVAGALVITQRRTHRTTRSPDAIS
jgi:hypothetical protein